MSNSNGINSKKILKRIIVSIIIVFAVLLAILAVLYALSAFINRNKLDYTDKQDGIYYFSADYEANPLEDVVYAAKDKQVFFTSHTGFGEYLSDADGDLTTVRGLMYNYFDALKTGNVDKHKELLSDEYKSNFVVQDKFTPQKVYDISVSFLSGDSNDGVYLEKYSVTYKIYKNDGTYRADVGSDISKTMVFEVVNQGNKALINSIVENISKGD